MIDPVLRRLLLDEIERHLGALSERADDADRKRAIHALRSSAAVAGERDFAQALGRIERRDAEGDPTARADARKAARAALEALRTGARIPGPIWPEPPADLRARPIDPGLQEPYAAEMRDRLQRIDAALENSANAGAAAIAAYREVHAVKGASLAAGDEVVAWFCHGLEERLQGAMSAPETEAQAVGDLARFRGVLAELISAPDEALDALRSLSRKKAPPRTRAVVGALPLPPKRPTEDPLDPDSRAPPDASLRVPAETLDRLVGRIHRMGNAHAQIAQGAAVSHDAATRSRRAKNQLAEALRLIGPPRPWGAPAAAIEKIGKAAADLQAVSERLDRGAHDLKESASRVRVETTAAHAELAMMTTTHASWLLERVATAVSAQARREGLEVAIEVTGGDSPIDRPLAEALFDPVLQLARNAVAHGIEPREEREKRGKPAVGSVRLHAEPRSGRLRLRVEDDGAGVDVARLRHLAVERGLLAAKTAKAADDGTLLSLLFTPGLTTRGSADLLAGRGVGLDLALAAVRRLGGTIRLASEEGMGLSATLEVPMERGPTKVIWLSVEDTSYALAVPYAKRILLGADAHEAVHLITCLSGRVSPSPAFGIELDLGEGDHETTQIGVDAIGAVEEVTLRAIPPLVMTTGPYAGAIVRGDELRLCLDAHALCEIARRIRKG